MWMNSIRGRKVGFLVRVVSILTWIPWIAGNLCIRLFDLERITGSTRYVPYLLLGYFATAIAFLLLWILRAVFIWLNDDTGERDPWKNAK